MTYGTCWPLEEGERLLEAEQPQGEEDLEAEEEQQREGVAEQQQPAGEVQTRRGLAAGAGQLLQGRMERPQLGEELHQEGLPAERPG